MISRRQFLENSASVAASTLASAGSRELLPGLLKSQAPLAQVSLNGVWKFQFDPRNVGVAENWSAFRDKEAPWRDVTVPHTWQIDPLSVDYRGVAWYRREFDAPSGWNDRVVIVEFEAVFHTATVWVNGKTVGEHPRRGYTSFSFDITSKLRWDDANVITVRVDNAFNEHMLPRGRSSDWANDGGIFRPVSLRINPKIFIERVAVNAVPNLANGEGEVSISVLCRNASTKSWNGNVTCRILDEETGSTVDGRDADSTIKVEPNGAESVIVHKIVSAAKLWHFDAPHLYRAVAEISDGQDSHTLETTFGIRKFEIRAGSFHLNGETVRLMGVERMAGSNPELGMAESTEWIHHDHSDLKKLNCVFTRVHWPQDHRVLDYCDRNGILMQSEIPAWGAATFHGMNEQPDSDIQQNGLEQLREMIERDRNHPSIVAWGLCNEIDGQNPAAYQFAKTMLDEAKRLDPTRLCSYASHSLRETPERDVARLMDFIETNEYFGSWQVGDARALDHHLETLHRTFPEKPIVVSEYGYCACTPERAEGDEHRVEILRTHDDVIRSKDFLGGAIFFCYNDYRTHVGDRGVGALRQRVHGVVDVYGAKKPSYTVLQRESSPIESLEIANHLNDFQLVVKSRSSLPHYTLQNYRVLGLFYGQGDVPVERVEAKLQDLPPGQQQEIELSFSQTSTPRRVLFQIVRPTRFSAYSMEWEP